MNPIPEPEIMKNPLLKLTYAWLILSAWASCAGLLLSWFGQLNEVGYVAAFLPLLLFGGWLACRQAGGLAESALRTSQKQLRRLQNPLAALFVLCVLASLLAALSYPISNIDTLSYRLGRVSSWLYYGRWQWLQTGDPRENFGALAHEWLWVPLLLIDRTGRLLFLPNLISFALLPGACFLMLRGCGLSGRASAAWSFVLPLGWCFIYQAAGTANDLIGASYGALAFALLFRWRQSESTQDLVLSLVAISLCLGTKQSTVFLALPYGALFLAFMLKEPKAFRLILSRWIIFLAIAPVLIACSILPALIFNKVHSGHWLGWSVESPVSSNLLATLIGNTTSFWVQNLAPPIFPWAAAWNSWIDEVVRPRLPVEYSARFLFRGIPIGLSGTNAGFGLIPWVVIAITVIAGCLCKLKYDFTRKSPGGHFEAWTLFLTSLIAFLILMAYVDLGPIARYAAPYYLFLLVPLVGIFGTGAICRQRWWRRIAVMNSLIALVLIVTSRQKPVWPAMPLIKYVQSLAPNFQAWNRLVQSYEFNNIYLSDSAAVLRKLPETAHVAIIAFYPRGLAALTLPKAQIVSLDDDPCAEDIFRSGADFFITNITKQFQNASEYEAWKRKAGFEEIDRVEVLMQPTGEKNTYVTLKVNQARISHQ